MTKHRLPIVMNDDLKKGLDRMATKLNMSKNQLALLALYSLVANYEKNGSSIFIDLLNPEHKANK